MRWTVIAAGAMCAATPAHATLIVDGTHYVAEEFTNGGQGVNEINVINGGTAVIGTITGQPRMVVGSGSSLTAHRVRQTADLTVLDVAEGGTVRVDDWNTLTDTTIRNHGDIDCGALDIAMWSTIWNYGRIMVDSYAFGDVTVNGNPIQVRTAAATAAPIPEPPALWGLGLAGLAFWRRPIRSGIAPLR